MVTYRAIVLHCKFQNIMARIIADGMRKDVVSYIFLPLLSLMSFVLMSDGLRLQTIAYASNQEIPCSSLPSP